MRLRTCADRAEWDAVVESFDSSLLFHSWDWLDLQEQVLRVVFERYVLEHEGELVGVFPLGRTARGSLVSPYLPYPFQGPLVAPHLVSHVPGALRRRQLLSVVALGRFDLGPLLVADWKATLENPMFGFRDRNTVVVDLSGPSSGEDLLASYARTHRRSVKRARGAGCRVRSAEPGEVTDLLPPLLEEGYGSRGDPCPYPPDVGRLVEAWAAGRDDVCLLVAEVQGEPAGLLVALGGRPTALAWAGGAFRRFRDLSVNILLYHEMMVWALEHGHERIDLCAGVDDVGAQRFKLAFGGELVPGLYVESSLVPRGALAKARHLRRLQA